VNVGASGRFGAQLTYPDSKPEEDKFLGNNAWPDLNLRLDTPVVPVEVVLADGSRCKTARRMASVGRSITAQRAVAADVLYLVLKGHHSVHSDFFQSNGLVLSPSITHSGAYERLGLGSSIHTR
jgi:hypothetical protein